MTRRAAGWAIFVGLGIAAAAGPLAWQLGYAAVAILTIGMAHGASDLAIVPPRRRPSFLAAYLAVVAGVLAWWLVAPSSALLLFLAASAIHFGLDDAPADRPVERCCRGVLMVAGPALLHRAALVELFGLLTGQPAVAAMLGSALAAGAMLALVALPIVVVRLAEADGAGAALRLATGAAALVALPPLVGFALGFVLLHAAPQLGRRMRRLGCASVGSYLGRTRAICGGAAAVTAAAAVLFLGRASPALSTLFAALAALALPHMIVTPAWTRAGERSVADGPRRLSGAV